MKHAFFMVKPGSVKVYHTGGIIHMLEKAGFVVQIMTRDTLDMGAAEEFYKEHKGKPFYDKLIEYTKSGPVQSMVLHHPKLADEEMIKVLRGLVGATNPSEAECDTIRGMYGGLMPDNAVHASDSVESASRELDFYSRYHNNLEF